MKFEELKENYLDMDSTERIVFITGYVEKRKIAIETETVSIKRKASKKKPGRRRTKTVSMNKEQMALAKALGLL
jgi:hypothetical protein